jgi:hypothetical protein
MASASMEVARQEELMQARACLGKWVDKDRNFFVFNETGGLVKDELYPRIGYNTKKFQIQLHRGYKPVQKYQLSLPEFTSHINQIRKDYKQETFRHPELQHLFKNGRPITSGDVFADSFFEGVQTNEPDADFIFNDLDFSDLMDAFK